MIFFLDESGTDHKESPYEVLAGVAIKEKDTWNLIQALDGLEKEHFGLNLHSVNVEFKGQNLLKPRRFVLAAQCSPIDRNDRRDITRDFLHRGQQAKIEGRDFKPKSEELAAYSQACIAFVHRVIEAAIRHSCKLFASIVPQHLTRPTDETLRKDYKYLLHRFFWMIEKMPGEQGILVFDEIERKESRRLITKLHTYCNETISGYSLSSKIIPTPFFINSEISPIIQIADLCAYSINWGLRLNRMSEPARPELLSIAEKVKTMGWSGRTKDQITTKVWVTYGVFLVNDLQDRQSTPKTREEVTESPPPKERQKVDKRPKPSPIQLTLFPEMSNTKASRYLDI